MDKRLLIASALAAAIVGPSLVSAAPAPEPTFKAEKCYGIAKAGKNDCASSGHACAGQSKTQSASEWLSLPKGTCDRIVGGSLTAPKKS
jgi:uncharacterized membrane protein